MCQYENQTIEHSPTHTAWWCGNATHGPHHLAKAQVATVLTSMMTTTHDDDMSTDSQQTWPRQHWIFSTYQVANPTPNASQKCHITPNSSDKSRPSCRYLVVVDCYDWWVVSSVVTCCWRLVVGEELWDKETPVRDEGKKERNDGWIWSVMLDNLDI
jgi:hypothetical protein